MSDRLGAGDVLETGVPQLDGIIGGGILSGSLVLVIGAPGTGKTILAQQIAFHHARQGHVALYLTGFSETHDKLLRHSRELNFFDPALLGTQIQFASLLDLLRAGAEETEEAIVATARAQRASLVVIDGFKGMRQILPDAHASAQFLYSLGAKLALLGSTTIVVVEGDPDESSRFSESTVCDVIVALRREPSGSRRRRLLEVVKARGSAPLEGLHPYTISTDGLAVYPRFEAVVGAVTPDWLGGRASLGNSSLDRLMGGGPNVGTATLVVGSPGVGKTLLGLHYAAEGARVGEPALFVSLVESAAQLRALASTFNIDVVSPRAAELLRILALPSYDVEADYITHLIREDIERRGVRRLVVDSVAELERLIEPADRKPGFLAALISYLRNHNVTSYFTFDIPTIVGSELDLTGTPVSVVSENLLLLRSVEFHGRLRRVLSVLKMRFSEHDHTIYDYSIIAGEGFRIQGPTPLGEGLLTGIPRLIGGSPPLRSGEG